MRAVVLVDTLAKYDQNPIPSIEVASDFGESKLRLVRLNLRDAFTIGALRNDARTAPI